jgi:hypothetical protein
MEDSSLCAEALANLAEPMYCVPHDEAEAIRDAAASVRRFVEADKYVNLPFRYSVLRLLELIDRAF